MALNQDTIVGLPYNTGGTLAKAAPETVADGVFVIDVDGQKWERVFDGGNSIFRASWLFNTGAPTDKTALVAIAVANSSIQTLEVDTTIQIDGAVDFAGKTLSVKSGGLVTGTYAISNAVIEGNLTQKILEPTGTLTASKSANGKWSTKWFGALSDGVSADDDAIDYSIDVANNSNQKIVLFPGGVNTYVISGTVTLPIGIQIEIDNGALLGGSGTLTGYGNYKASESQNVFDSTLTVSGIYPSNNKVSPFHFGAVGDGYLGAGAATDDAAAIQRMFNYVGTMVNNIVVVEFPARIYYQNTTVELPRSMGRGYWVHIKGYGATIRHTSDDPIWQRMPIDQTDATANLLSDWRGVIEGLYFAGNSTAANPKTSLSGLKLGALYGWVFRNLSFVNVHNGIEIYFGLGCLIDSCYISQTNIGIYGRFGNWSGASVSNSSFNANNIINSRAFNLSGSLASIYLLEADQTKVSNFISEGNNPLYNFYLSTVNNTGVLQNKFEDIWVESTGGTYTSNTVFYLRPRGLTTIKNLQRIYPNLLFDCDLASGATLIFDGLPYLSNNPTPFFKVPDSQTGKYFVFRNTVVNSEAIIFDVAKWDGANFPLNIRIEHDAQSANGGYKNRYNSGSIISESSLGSVFYARTSNRPSVRINTNATNLTTGLTVLGHSDRDGTFVSSIMSNDTIMALGSNNAAANIAIIKATATGTGRPAFCLIHMRGTTDTPIKLGNSDNIGEILAKGYDGAGLTIGGRLFFQADGAVSSGVMPTRLRWYVMNSAGVQNEVLGIRASGQFELPISPTTTATLSTDAILLRKSTGEMLSVATTSIVAVSAGTNRLAYYAAANQSVASLSAITANRALISDANGLPVAATTTATEIGYLNGVTSPIQAQIGTKGLYATNGDGILTTFTVTHGFAGTPTNVQVTPAGVDSAVPFFVNNITATTFDVTFTTPPIVGTNNVTFYWTAK